MKTAPWGLNSRVRENRFKKGALGIPNFKKRSKRCIKIDQEEKFYGTGTGA
jgi:hypothetical protein